MLSSSSNWGSSLLRCRRQAELLNDCEEDRVLRAVLVGMLAEMKRKG
jgi:hypothetical protein